MNMRRFVQPDSNNSVMRRSQRETSVYIIGQPGTGKSRLIESWFMQDVLAGNGVGIIDPHGDLFNHLVARIALYPDVWKRVIIINPCDQKWAVSINPLVSVNNNSAIRMAWFLTDIILKIWSIKMASAPRMSWLMGNTFAALAELRMPLTALPRFLLDADYRSGHIPRIKNNEIRAYFEFEFPTSIGGVKQWVAPLLNKIGGFLYDPDIRTLLDGNISLDFRQVIDDNCILLVNIPKGILGENASALLGAFIVAQLQKAALSRAQSSYRTPFYLYLDEFQNYTTENIRDILSEARKYELSLILANQYLSQLTTEIREAVLNTAGTLVSFRIGYNDASKMARHIFPSSDFFSRKKIAFNIRGSNLIPHLSIREEKVDANWEKCAQTLAALPKRKFWIRYRAINHPERYRSLNMPDPIMNDEMEYKISALVETSGIRYANLKNKNGQGDENDYQPLAMDSKSGDNPLWSI